MNFVKDNSMYITTKFDFNLIVLELKIDMLCKSSWATTGTTEDEWYKEMTIQT